MKFPFLWVCMLAPSLTLAQTEARPRIRDLGVPIGILQPGPLNAITDVAGVKVGQTTPHGCDCNSAPRFHPGE
jgi:D-aminopeptidase